MKRREKEKVVLKRELKALIRGQAATSVFN
jgi:hypothetical protein